MTTANTPCRTTTGNEKLCSGGSDPVPGNGWPGHSERAPGRARAYPAAGPAGLLAVR